MPQFTVRTPKCKQEDVLTQFKAQADLVSTKHLQLRKYIPLQQIMPYKKIFHPKATAKLYPLSLHESKMNQEVVSFVSVFVARLNNTLVIHYLLGTC